MNSHSFLHVFDVESLGVESSCNFASSSVCFVVLTCVSVCACQLTLTSLHRLLSHIIMSDVSVASAAAAVAAPVAEAAPAATSAGKKKNNKKKNDASSAAAASPVAAVSAVAAVAAPAQSAAAAAASSDALMDLLASKIDHLEGVNPNAVDETALTPAEVSDVTAKIAALQAGFTAAQSADATNPWPEAANQQLATLLDLYQSELQSRIVANRLLAESKEKLTRAGNQKKNLENLCRELQTRNKKVSVRTA